MLVTGQQEQRPQGNIILLHDAGGNRGQTVAALPRIIDYLKERGDQIVSLGQLLGVPSESLMPPLAKNQQPIRRLIYDSGFKMLHMVGEFGWTEAPQTFTTLTKQRVRWAFGTLQCLWKHRDLVGNPRFKALGLFSLPSIWLFQILLVAVGPVVDALLLFSLFFGMGAALLPYLVAFLVMDLFLAGLACAMEGEPLRRAWLVLPMRLIYRPLLAWVIWRSLIRAVKGAWVGWGKLERSATITFGA